MAQLSTSEREGMLSATVGNSRSAIGSPPGFDAVPAQTGQVRADRIGEGLGSDRQCADRAGVGNCHYTAEMKRSDDGSNTRFCE